MKIKFVTILSCLFFSSVYGAESNLDCSVEEYIELDVAGVMSAILDSQGGSITQLYSYLTQVSEFKLTQKISVNPYFQA
ncbi:MAG: hypothetical protein P8X89_24490 [Reinekea sp.]